MQMTPSGLIFAAAYSNVKETGKSSMNQRPTSRRRELVDGLGKVNMEI